MLNVLYVDDEQINLELFELSFRKDFVVHKSLDAKDGLDILDNESIDVIVSDLRMPEMNGIEFIKVVKQRYPDKNCILLTAFDEPNLIKDPEVKSILFSYILKPFRKEELKSIIIEASDNP